MQRAGMDTAEIRNIPTPGSQVLCRTELASRQTAGPSVDSTKTHAPSAHVAPWLPPCLCILLSQMCSSGTVHCPSHHPQVDKSQHLLCGSEVFLLPLSSQPCVRLMS